jgi:hypothetical protein
MAVAAWTAEASFMAMKILTIDKVIMSGVDITHEIYAAALQRAAMVLIGISFACMAFIWIKRWRWLVATSAVLYLGVWYMTGTTSSVPLVEAYTLKWTTAKMFGTYVSFALRDVILPLCFLSVLVAAGYSGTVYD